MTESTEVVAGTVLRLHRYPLKSADGEQLDAVHVGRSGLEADRRWALARADGSPLTAKQLPALRDVQARTVDGELSVDADLAQLAGEPVQVLDAPGEHQQVAAVHLVSAGAHLATDAPPGCDPEPRANLVVDLPAAGAERGWLGRRLRVGQVELTVTRTPSSCLGVYAEVDRPGTVAVGDPVVLLD